MPSIINLYNRVFPLYRPTLPFVARIALFHLIHLAVVGMVLFLGDVFEFVLFGDEGWPTMKLNSAVELFGRVLERIDYYELFDFDWHHHQADIFELNEACRMVLCGLAGWVTWKMVGKRVLEPTEQE